ncbi:MAG: iron uptake porin [Scytolyngbya sp. HA4215-MV1]|jgi:hypothetical protein|nr:iron uptake porin [Scytolyngbya sp. HA4215-MV1]
MSNFLRLLWLTPAVLGMSLIGSPASATTTEALTTVSRSNTQVQSQTGILAAIPQPKPTTAAMPIDAIASDSTQLSNQYTTENQGTADIDQVTSVSQLSDVQPTDWAFQALQSLVERYGCIAGYPDGTFKGNRALTRYEFAAGVNACLDRVNELIAAGTTGLATKEDLATLQKLQEEFAAELATLRGRVDALEARATDLEKHQFSTTTKLNAEVIFSLAGAFGGDKAVPSGGVAGSAGEVDDNIAFSDRVRLNFDTSFTGKDRLRTRLEARNTAIFDGGAATRPNLTGTNETRLSYDGDEGNDFRLSKLFYRFPLGSQATVVVDATGGEYYDNLYTFNPSFESSGTGSLSRFGRFNPIYRLGAGGAGATLNYNFGKQLTFSLGYLADEPADPSSDRGLLNGSFAALAQVAFRPSKNLDLGFTYARSYDRGGNVDVTSATGSGFSRRPFGANVATSGDNFSLQAAFKLSPKFTIAGWAGYTNAHRETGLDQSADIWNWAVTLALSDLGKKGNLAGLILGQPPKVTNNDLVTREDDNSSFHVEGLYRYQVNNNISITPGLIVIFNPENNNDNDTTFVGVVRTTFRF